METFTPIDSFSQIHSYAYSIIALQELNLNYFYPRVYWNCACLSCEAMGLKDNEDGSDKASSTDYGEIAKAIYKMKQSGIEVSPPSINESNLDFTPIESSNSILFGLSGISGINKDIANQIIANRPYSSFNQFYQLNSYSGSLVTESKFVQLIKAGCFDEFEPDRTKVMKEYITLSNTPKESLGLNNIPEILRMGCNIPSALIGPYKFKKYVCSSKFLYGPHPNFKSKKLYRLDSRGEAYFRKKYMDSLQEDVDYFFSDDTLLVVDKSLDKILKPVLDSLKEYINTDEFKQKFYTNCVKQKYDQLCPNKDTNHWSFEACSFYSHDHELAHIDTTRYNIIPFDQLPSTPQFEIMRRGSREWRRYEIVQIAGTILSRDDNKHILSLLDMSNNVVQCKFNAEAFSFYKRQISAEDENGNSVVMDMNWLRRGQPLILTGYKVSDTEFRVKSYKSSIYQHKVKKITQVYPNGDIDIQVYRYGFGPEDEEI